MKTMKFIFIWCLWIGIVQVSDGQSKRHKKWDEAITSLERTDFIKEYKQLKTAIETQVSAFHQEKHTIALEDFEKVGKYYEETVEDINLLFTDLKNSFKDKNLRDAITQNPDAYTRRFKQNLEDAKIKYENKCHAKIDALMYSDSGALGITEISAIMALVGELVKIVDKWQKKVEDMSGTYLENNFIRDLRLKEWDSYIS